MTDKFGGLIYGESCAKNIEQTIDVDLSVKSIYSVATECGSWLLYIHKNCVSFEMFYFSVYEKGNKRIRVFAIYHKMNLICDSQMLFENTQKCCVDALLLQY